MVTAHLNFRGPFARKEQPSSLTMMRLALQQSRVVVRGTYVGRSAASTEDLTKRAEQRTKPEQNAPSTTRVVDVVSPDAGPAVPRGHLLTEQQPRAVPEKSPIKLPLLVSLGIGGLVASALAFLTPNSSAVGSHISGLQIGIAMVGGLLPIVIPVVFLIGGLVAYFGKSRVVNR